MRRPKGENHRWVLDSFRITMCFHLAYFDTNSTQSLVLWEVSHITGIEFFSMTAKSCTIEVHLFGILAEIPGENHVYVFRSFGFLFPAHMYEQISFWKSERDLVGIVEMRVPRLRTTL